MRKLAAIVVLVLAGCGGGGGGGGEPATVATPAFSPAAGTYSAVQNVTITCATAGAAIHYTTDGSTPTASSTTYAAAVPVTTTTTVKAMATAAGKSDSAVATAIYTLQAATPIISPAAGTYSTAQSVTITSATPSAVIHYTTDGSAPTAASATYTAAIPLPAGEVATTTTVRAIAVVAGFADSAVASSTFTIDPAATPAVAPTFAPQAGTYTTAQNVVISSTSAGATVYYTADGSTPTTASTVYATPVLVNASKTLKAIAAGGGFTASTVASAAYVINLPQAATPTFTPGPGTYPAAQSVVITSTTAGATIYYTADGSTPTTGSTVYAAPVSVPTSRTLRAIATAPGFAPSAVGSAPYVISGGGTPFVTLCNALFDKVTSLFETCLQANPALVSSLLGTGPVFCTDRQREIAAGKISYDATAGAACTSAIQALDCRALSADTGFSPPATCQASLVGLVAAGGQCWDSADCATGWCGWDLSAGTCPDTCRPFIQAGGACDGAGCADGLVCDGPFGAQTCKAPSAAGLPCPCLDGLWCDTSGATDVCRAFLATGASCTPAGDPCNILATCAGSPSTCQAWLAAGATCDPADSRCGLGYECSATSKTCVSWPTLDQACAGFCLNAWCDLSLATPICKALLVDGATCNPLAFGQCLSGSCNFVSSKCDPTPLNRCVIP